MLRVKILEHAYSKQALFLSLMSKSDTWFEHLLKIFYYHDIAAAEINHWKREVYSCYPRVSKIKSTKKFPKADEIYHCIFGSSDEDGISKEEISGILELFSDEYPKYTMCHTLDEYDKALEFVREYGSIISEILSNTGSILPSKAFSLIEECYEKAIK